MKVLYYSSLAFTDCDFPLIKKYQENGVECRYVLNLVPTKLTGGLFRLNRQPDKSAIISASQYPEFDAYKDYINLDQVYFVNRRKAGLHPLNILLYFKLILFILRFRPDVIHCTSTLWGAEWLLYIFAYKMVLTVHDPFEHSGEGDYASRKSRDTAFKRFRKLILLNDKQKDEFISHYGIPSKKVYVNSLGVYDCLRVTESNTDIAPNEKYVLFFGRISPYKGIDVLCEAMKKVHEVLPELHCVIAGGGKMYFDYTPYKSLSYMHLMNRFIDTPELGELIKGSIFTICPYKDATQSGVVFSSLAYNKPIIASNVGALSDAVIDGKTGILVEPNDSDALANAIISLAREPKLLQSISETIDDIFKIGSCSWDAISNKYIEIYKD